MNRNELHIFQNMTAVLLFCTSFVSCSQDNLSEAQNGPLPLGQYPLELTAGGLQAVMTQTSTRATVDGDWNGVNTVAVQVGYDVKSYNATSTDGGNTATLSSGNPFYWENTAEKKTVIAWHPYSKFYPTDWTVKADQSTAANYQASDLVRGELKDLAFADRNDPSKSKMTFAHQTAKVVVNLVAGDGVTLDANTSVRLNNLFGVDKGSTITPYKAAINKHTYLALLKEQTLIAKSSFMQVTTGDGTFLYKLPNAKTFKAGTAYTYNITVKANGIEVTEATGGEWTSGGSEDVASKTVSEKYTAADLKIGDYYYDDGTTSDGGLRKLYSDGTKMMENPKPAPVLGKTAIGVVFHVGQHQNDLSDYSGSGIGQQKCRGYVVALSDATPNLSKCKWGVYGTELGCYPKDGSGKARNNYSNPDIDWSGYNYTQTIINHVGGKDKLNASEESGYSATYYAVVAYENETSSPANSSGWFLPSVGQLNKVYQQRNLFDSIVGSGGLKDKDYWTSSELYNDPKISAIVVNMGSGYLFSWSKWTSFSPVRAVLAF